jgi:hypothetical protein
MGIDAALAGVAIRESKKVDRTRQPILPIV